MPSNMRPASPLASSCGISRYILKSASRYSSNESAPFFSSALASASIAAISAVMALGAHTLRTGSRYLRQSFAGLPPSQSRDCGAVPKCDLRLTVDPKCIGTINGLATHNVTGTDGLERSKRNASSFPSPDGLCQELVAPGQKGPQDSVCPGAGRTIYSSPGR